jgi:hypothetical protein
MRITKRIAALLLALVMSAFLAVPAFAVTAGKRHSGIYIGAVTFNIYDYAYSKPYYSYTRPASVDVSIFEINGEITYCLEPFQPSEVDARYQESGLIILYRNSSLLSAGFDSSGKTGSIKAAAVFDIAFIVAVSVFGILVKTGRIHVSENQEALFYSALIAALMGFVGIVAPRLPYNRHIGLRLPWTVQNEGAWNIAHRILGIISIPLGLAYMSLTFFVSNMETLTLIAVLVWIGVPGLVSFLYTYKK